MQVIPVGYYQIEYICNLLDKPEVVEFCNKSEFFKEFRIGLKYDMCRRHIITDRQLFQVKKISDLTGMTWRLVI